VSSVRQRLAKYKAKRDFQITPEPPPSEPRPRSGAEPLTFMVHKHDATRLHYDLRLEMAGVLASWAIPKGPSYDPGQKRLAVQTEDHPLEYGNFEGRIPDGEYGAGDSLIWDRGTYDTVPPGQAEQQRKKGRMLIQLQGEKLKGGWHLVRTRPLGGKEQWLFFKAKDGLEAPDFDVVAQHPESVLSGKRATRRPVTKSSWARPHPPPESLLAKVWPPMLATLAQPPIREDEYWLEVKYDGYRGIAALSAGRLAFQTRNKLDLSGRFPDVARALLQLRTAEVVLDGEVVAFDPKGVARFQQLMTPGVEHHYIVFDLLWLDGDDLRKRPIEERRDLLESVLAGVAGPIQLSQRLDYALNDVLKEVKRLGLEGVMAKRRGSAYTGARSSDWLKIKVFQAQEVVIVGYTPISTGSNEIGALLVGVRDGEKYRFAGKVGTGFTHAVRQDLRGKLERERIENPAVVDPPRERGAVWVKPKYVAEVAFGEWTRDGRLRHPSFQGLREDKKPEEVIRELPKKVEGGVPPDASRSSVDVNKRVARASVKAPTVELTHPDKVLYPKSGITKRDVFEYFRHIAPSMLPALQERALAFEQWPQGIAKPGIFRQHAKGIPSWATTAAVPHERGKVSHLVVDRAETLLWLANQSALTLHIPSSRISRLTEPDWVLFDLDPPEGKWNDLIELADALRKFLQQLGIDSVPKTSGKRGLHVVVPIARGHTYEDALNFAVAITRTLERGLPKLATTERSIAKRQGRIYLDAMQNGYSKTMVAPYSLRAVEGAPASTPLRWAEVTPALDPLKFNIKTMQARLNEVGDLFAPVLKGHQRLPRLQQAEGK